MILENEDSKHKEEYGYVKKEFQQMIYDNLVGAEELERVIAEAKSKIKQEYDNSAFGLTIMGIIGEEAKKYYLVHLDTGIVLVSTFIKPSRTSPLYKK